MPLQATLSESDFDGLDESLKTLYKQNDENKQFYLDISPDEAGKLAFNLQTSVSNLEKNNGDLTKQLKDARAKNKDFDSLGKTAEEIKAALEVNRPEEVTKMVEKYETEKQSLAASYGESLNAVTEKAQARERELRKVLTASAISKLRLEYDLNDTADFVLREFVRAEPKDENSDEFIVRVYENGSPALIAGQPKTPEQLVKGFKEEKKFLSMFNAPNGGGTGGTNRQGTFNNKNLDGLSGAEMLKQGRAA